ncbi:hypothetical protein HN014_15985 [Aquimarina sp. TRL1]|uniref:hypothetical protein n=1 Tax=Aquimarina sp. (strain TRL1) TaxID=2736252 RepID=UPI00158D06A0|nr:hypothetical protein [Aquimarina sp. TRL1]QKX06348.1 hypothetical protein HN014_15985 [Aquimarina sp. TRL1]
MTRGKISVVFILVMMIFGCSSENDVQEESFLDTVITLENPILENILLNELVIDTDSDGKGDASLDQNKDGKIQKTEADAVFNMILKRSDLQGGDEKLTSLKGIEYFENLFTLDVSGHDLETLALTNLEIRELVADENALRSVDTKKLPNLEKVSLQNNQLVEVDFFWNQKLHTIELDNNKLITLDINAHEKVVSLSVANNRLSRLLLNIDKIELLQNLNVVNNELECIGVPDVIYADTNISWKKDTITLYATDCNRSEIIVFTNETFKEVLRFEKVVSLNGVNLDSDVDFNNDGEISLIEAEAVRELNLKDKGLNSLDEIKYFKNLERLNIDNNQIAVLNLSKNLHLKDIQAEKNGMTAIDLSKNQKIESIKLFQNNLVKLEVNSEALRELSCGFSGLQELSIPLSKHVEHLFLAGNELTSVNISHLTKINYLNVSENKLTFLNINNGNNEVLQSLDTSDNPELQCVQVDDIEKAETYMNSNTSYEWVKDTHTQYKKICE